MTASTAQKGNASNLMPSQVSMRDAKKRKERTRNLPLKGPQRSSFLHMVNDQTSQEAQSQVFWRQWIYFLPNAAGLLVEGSPTVFSHQLYHLDRGAELDVQSQRNRTSAGWTDCIWNFLSYGIHCYFSVAFRCVLNIYIFKHTCELVSCKLKLSTRYWNVFLLLS